MLGRRYHRFFFFVLVIPGLALGGCGQGVVTSAPEEPPVEETSNVINATGVVVPVQWANLSLQAAGTVEQVFVSEGEQVQAGQLLVRLVGGDPAKPSPQLQAALRTAELDVQGAQQALNGLEDAAEAALWQAEEAIQTYATQIRELDLQIEKMDIAEDLAELEPEIAFDQARAAYQKALEAWEPVKNWDEDNSTRKNRRNDLNNAKEDYEDAVKRLSLSKALVIAETGLEKARQDAETYAQGPRQEDILLARRRLESATAALEVAKAAPDELCLRAPFTGTVSEVRVQPGEWVSPGVPVIVLADLSHLVVETTDLNEIDAARIQVENQAQVTFDALAEVTVKGQVVHIASRASTGAGVNFRIVIEMEQVPGQLRWGMSAFVDVIPGVK